MIKIISDTATMYSPAEGEAMGVVIAPLQVTIADKCYNELEDISAEEFVDIINQGHLPTSSQPAVGRVVDAYNAAKGDEIIHLAMADGLSGTYQSSLIAQGMVENADDITIINTTTLCGPERYMFDLTMKMAALGKTKAEIVAQIEALIPECDSFLMPNDFDYLVRGGRLSAMKGRIAKAIKLVPILQQTPDGKRLDQLGAKRTFPKAVEFVAEKMAEIGINKEEHKLFVSHGCAEELGAKAHEILKAKFGDIDINVAKLTPAFITQGGPSCVAIQYIKKVVL